MAGKPNLLTQLGLPPAISSGGTAEVVRTINAIIRALRVLNGETGELDLTTPAVVTNNLRAVNRFGVDGVEINAPGSGVTSYVVKVGAADIFILAELPTQPAPDGSLCLRTDTGGLYLRQGGVWTLVGTGGGGGGGGGTVTQVDASGGTTGLTFTGVPFTTFGVITLSGTLNPSNGGTGTTTTPPAGAVAYGNGTAYAFSAVGATGEVLTSNGAGAPTWAVRVSSVDASGGSTGLSFTGGPVTSSGTLTLGGTLVIANGGTNSTATPTAGGVAYGDGVKYLFNSVGVAGQFLKSNGAAAPTWSAAVTSVNASGGSTGLTFSGGPVTTTGTLTLSGILNTANGGTGTNSAPTAGTVAYGNGATLAYTSVGTPGQVLVSTGSTPPIWATAGLPSVYTATVDFGSTPTADATLTITHPVSLTSTAVIDPFIAPQDSTVDNDAGQHAFAGMSLRLTASPPNPSGTTITLNATALVGLVTGTFKVRYLVY